MSEKTIGMNLLEIWKRAKDGTRKRWQTSYAVFIKHSQIITKAIIIGECIAPPIIALGAKNIAIQSVNSYYILLIMLIWLIIAFGLIWHASSVGKFLLWTSVIIIIESLIPFYFFLISFIGSQNKLHILQYELTYAGVLSAILLALGTFLMATKTAESIALTHKIEKAKITPACYILPTAQYKQPTTTGNCPPAYLHWPDIDENEHVLRQNARYNYAGYVIDCDITNGGNGAAYNVRMILAEQLGGPHTQEILLADILATNQTITKRFKIADYLKDGNAAIFIQSITKVILRYKDSDGSEYYSIKNFLIPECASEYPTTFNSDAFKWQEPPAYSNIATGIATHNAFKGNS